ncbi:MAG: hypothetical protein FIA97_18050 [Methylococcaceae bacterium]|nr:hypothetical protein [Methylococcaceae bacterium]
MTPDRFRFADLFAALLRRISMPTYFHSAPLDIDFASLTRATAGIAVHDRRLRCWYDWTSPSLKLSGPICGWANGPLPARPRPWDWGATAPSPTACTDPPPPPTGGIPRHERPRILLAVTGLSPQVVSPKPSTPRPGTAASRPGAHGSPPVHHRPRGRTRPRLNLLSEDPGRFHRLRRDYALPDIAFYPSRTSMY